VTRSLASLLAAPSPPLRVESASIGADLFENSFTRRPLALEHRIDMTFGSRPEGTPRLHLGPFEFGSRSWEGLAGLEWRPPEPEIVFSDGEPQTLGRAHGKLELGDARLDVGCEHVRFGALAGATLPVTLDIVVDEPAGQRVELEANLTIGPIRVLGDIVSKPRPDVEQALALARERLDLKRLEPRLEAGVVLLDHV
jgi:hypothetical protein